MQFKEVLVVCTGNICRSPMAAALLAERLRSGPEPPRIGSAGTAALVGQGAAPEAVALMAERGVDLSGHRARQLNHEIVKGTDLVLAADAGHRHWVNAQFPFMHGRVHLLGRWQGDIDIPDPYLQGMPAFEHLLDTLDACVEDWLEKMDPKFQV